MPRSGSRASQPGRRASFGPLDRSAARGYSALSPPGKPVAGFRAVRLCVSGSRAMLIDRLAASLATAKPYATITALLGEGSDATLATPGLIRPAIVAALHSQEPRPTLVVVSGEENAERFWRQTAAFLGQRRVLHYPERSDYPWSGTAPDLEQIGARARALLLAREEPSGHRGRLGTCAAPDGAAAGQPRLRSARRSRPDSRIDLEEHSRAARHAWATSASRSPRTPASSRCAAARSTSSPPDSALPGARRAVRRRDRDAQALRALDRPDDRRLRAGRGASLPGTQHWLAWRRERAEGACVTRRSRTRSSRTSSSCSSRASTSTGSSVFLPLLYKRPGHAHRVPRPRRPRRWSPSRARSSTMPSAAEKSSRRWPQAARGHRSTASTSRPAELDFGERQRLTLLSIFRAGAGVDAELAARRPEVAGGEERFVGGRPFAALDRATRSRSPCPTAAPGSRIADLLAEAGVRVEAERDHATAADASERPRLHAAGQGGRRGRRHRRPGRLRHRRRPARGRLRRRRLPALGGPARAPPDRPDARSRSPSRPATTSCTRRTASRCSRRSCARRCSARSATTCCSSTPRATSSTCRSSRSTASPSTSAPTAVVAARHAPQHRRLVARDRQGAQGGARSSRSTSSTSTRAARRSTGYAFGAGHAVAARDGGGVPVRGDARPARRHRRRQGRHGVRQADGPPDLRRRRLRQDRGRHPRRVQGHAGRQAGHGPVPDDHPRAAALHHLLASASRRSRCDVEVLSRFRSEAQQKAALEGFARRRGRRPRRHAPAALARRRAARPRPRRSSTRSSASASSTRSTSRTCASRSTCSTLSATPIPRTLQMSLSGVRDMCVIDTPPPNRFPVQVHVGEWDEDVVSGAIRRELERGGQVYYVHNRVKTIDEAVRRVSDGRARGAHRRRARPDVASTSSSASWRRSRPARSTCSSPRPSSRRGIDNPHTNTLIIEDSQRLGLAQLYQLKGRVGPQPRQGVRVLPVPGAASRSPSRPTSGSTPSARTPSSAAASRSRCATSRSAAPARCSAPSSTGK